MFVNPYTIIIRESTEGVFVFAAKPTPASSDELKEKPPDTLSHSKRCRVDCGERDEFVGLRKSVRESFKSKLVVVANPVSWAGFGSKKEKLNLEEGDVSVTLDSDDVLINLSEDLKDRYKRYRNNGVNKGYCGDGLGGVHNVENLGKKNVGDRFFSRKHFGAGAGAEAKLGSRPSGGSFIGSDVGASSSGSKVGVNFCGGKAGSWASGGKARIESSGGKAGVVSSGGKTGLTSGSDRVGFVSNCVRMRSRFAVLDEEVMESIEVAREAQNSKVVVAHIDTPLSDICNTSGMCKNVSSGKKEAKSKGKDKGLSKGVISKELLHQSMLDSSISKRMVLGYEDSCIDSPQQTSKSYSSMDRQVMVGPSGSGDGL
ncbi:hypothetical protein ACOSQ3_031622 [Xanthoceras sorbifolium]